MAKRGRPALEDPRDNQYRLRLNNVEYGKLTKISKELGMSRSDTLRTLIENHKLKGE